VPRLGWGPDEPVEPGDAEDQAAEPRPLPEAMDLRGLARARPPRLSTFALTQSAPAPATPGRPVPGAPVPPPGPARPSATGRRHGPAASARVVRMPPPERPPAGPLAALPVPDAVGYPPAPGEPPPEPEPEFEPMPPPTAGPRWAPGPVAPPLPDAGPPPRPGPGPGWQRHPERQAPMPGPAARPAPDPPWLRRPQRTAGAFGPPPAAGYGPAPHAAPDPPWLRGPELPAATYGAAAAAGPHPAPTYGPAPQPAAGPPWLRRPTPPAADQDANTDPGSAPAPTHQPPPQPAADPPWLRRPAPPAAVHDTAPPAGPTPAYEPAPQPAADPPWLRRPAPPAAVHDAAPAAGPAPAPAYEPAPQPAADPPWLRRPAPPAADHGVAPAGAAGSVPPVSVHLAAPAPADGGPPPAASVGTVLTPPPSRARPVRPPAATVIAGDVLASTVLSGATAAPARALEIQRGALPDAGPLAPRRQPAPMPPPLPGLPRSEPLRRAGWAAGRQAPNNMAAARRQARLDPAASQVLVGIGLIAAYIAICLSPLAIVSIGHTVPRRPFLVDFSVALGYVGLAMMVLQFTLVSRIKWLAKPFGIDVLQCFHREVSYVALAFVFAHPALLLVQSVPTYLPLFDVRTAPWRARYAVAACAALLLVVFVSIWRRKLRVPYELWKFSHGLLSTGVMFLALAHMVGVNRFTAGTGGRLVVLLVGIAVVAILGWSRLVAPRVHLFQQWRVVEITRERGRAFTLVVEPHRHPGWSFMPGQFAWVTVGRSPFKLTQHPFSFSSPGDVGENGRINLTIKEAGDWTRRIASITPDTRVYLDGPHGSFSIDVNQAPGYVFIAGGVGITPMFSMISTMCLRDDTRPAILFYANPDWDSITFREQLDELSTYMANLRVVHVLKTPPPGWRGETGRVTPEMLERYLPRQYQTFDYFICASEAMTDAVEEMLLGLGVPAHHVHAERFGMV
jgi:predicted ferric reductase